MAVSDPPRSAAWNAAEFEGLYRCVHCGLCLQACPTYRELGLETDSPRGRLYLMRAMVEGRIEMSEGVVTHMNRCLVCRACEPACPSGVPFGHLMELTRDRIRQQWPQPAGSTMIRRLMLGHVIPHARRLRWLSRLGLLYQRSGLQKAVRAAGLLPHQVAQAEELMPAISPDPFQPPAGGWFRAKGSARYRVGLLSGCIMSVAFAGVDRATVRVLNRNGCDVFTPPQQTCCGALHAHDGDLETARELARRNIEAFQQEQLDAIVMNAAGCGAMMKEYGELLAGDPAYASRAARLAANVKDVTEFLAGLGINEELGRLDWTVTYQDPCHLAHGQRIREAPRELLRAVPGLKLVEMRDSDRCCGSAGIYNLTQPELSRRFMAEKAQAAAETNAEVIVSANPGCIIQLQAGLRERGSRASVKHIVEVLDEAYQRREEGNVH
ncbi:MAG TPA: heterodisulfide reductase-related iron-sulfur binding cluster [Chloroflexota bacterium]